MPVHKHPGLAEINAPRPVQFSYLELIVDFRWQETLGSQDVVGQACTQVSVNQSAVVHGGCGQQLPVAQRVH